LLKLSQATEEIPRCFGSKFDNTAVECTGGNDPAFDDEEGGHIRPKCDMMSACASRTQAASRGAHQVIPTQSIVRPSTTFSPPPSVAQPYRPNYPGHVQHPQQHAYQQPQVGLNQLVSTNYGMPQYLTVREPANGKSLGARLGGEILRSLVKSFGHTLAHFFDVESIGTVRKE
jgi:hypothetical protein